MKALFIGGTGTISTDVVALAQQRGWEITLLNRGSKKMPEGIRGILADINDEDAVAKAIANESYDVVAQFIAYTAEDVKRDIRLFHNKHYTFLPISLPVMEKIMISEVNCWETKQLPLSLIIRR